MSTSQPTTTTPAYTSQERVYVNQDVLGKKRRYHNKQSSSYIIRSGIAGGVAGCVVYITNYTI